MRIALTRIATAAVIAAAAMVVTLAGPGAAPARALSVGDGGAVKGSYGQGFYFLMTTSCYTSTQLTVSEKGRQLLTSPDSGRYVTFSSNSVPPFDVGTHSLDVAVATPCGAETASLTVTVTTAALSFDARMAADPSSPGNAIISVRALGDFMDQLPSAAYRGPNDPRFPAGTWAVTVKDENGKEVHQVTIDGQRGDPGYVSSYWLGAPQDSQLTATATFTPTGSTARDFAVTAPDSVSYTSAQQVRAGLSKPEDDGPPTTPPPTGFTLPLWVLPVSGIAGLVVLVVAILAAVRLRRRLHRLDELVAPLGSGAPRAS